MKDYILFLGQEANFQTRSLLIPHEEFISVPKRKNDYEMLKRSSVSCSFMIEGKKYDVDNLLTINVVDGFQEPTEYLKIVNDLMFYADPPLEDCYANIDDKVWYDESFLGFAHDFNHIKNHEHWKNVKEFEREPINIVDSFLVLEMWNGKLNYPTYDTVAEMYASLYSK